VPHALTREVSPALAVCELTHLERCSIDVDRARAQHTAYERALGDAGCTVERLPATADMPDSVFIEDIAVVLDEFAIVTRPGAESRRGEVPAVVEALGRYRSVHTIQPPATIDGGDVLVVGRRVFIGRSTRTNADAIVQMRRLLTPSGYTVCDASVRGCLHLKSAVTAVAADVLLANPGWLEAPVLADFDVVVVDPGEPMAANALRVGDRVIYPTAFPRTAERLAARGFNLQLVDASELAKAEGAVTCCSLIID
jgi:dimethylargininase